MDYPNNQLRSADLLSITLDYPHNPLGDAVLAFAVGWLSMDESFLATGLGIPPPPVGDGQCTALVAAALNAAGAQPGDTSDPKHYTWGAEVTKWVLPDPPVPEPPEWGTWQSGDIIQFWDAKFDWHTNGWHVLKPGSAEDADRRHTAIILRPPLVNINPRFASSDPWGTWLVHQNDNNLKYVTRRLIYLRYLVSGQFIVYRPVLPPPPSFPHLPHQ